MNNLKLFFAPGTDLSVTSLNKCQFVKLLHPRTDKYIVKSGHAYVCSEIDLTFLFLPALIETEKFTTTDGLLRLQIAPGLPHLFTESSLSRLQRVCDKKSIGSHNVIRLNKDKLKVWLKQRVDNICRFTDELSTTGDRRLLHSLLSVHSQSSASAPLFASDSKSAKALATAAFDGDALRSFAFQIIADNLPVTLIEQLHSDLGLELLPSADKENMATLQASELISKSDSKNPKASERRGPTEDYSASLEVPKTEPTPTPSATKKAKFARGSQSITSFFSKK
nr:unnamed protein product [Spirometra erinaceieuropaei]